MTFELILYYSNLILDLYPEISKQAQFSYPNEICGFILKSGLNIPVKNSANSLNSPFLNSRNSFYIDQNSWKSIEKYSNDFIALYHSHTNNLNYLSEADMNLFDSLPFLFPLFSITDEKVIDFKIYYKDNGDFKYINHCI